MITITDDSFLAETAPWARGLVLTVSLFFLIGGVVCLLPPVLNDPLSPQELKNITPIGCFGCSLFLLYGAGKRRFFLDYQTGRYEERHGFPFFERTTQGDIRTDALCLQIRKLSNGQTVAYIKWRGTGRTRTYLGGGYDENPLLVLKSRLESQFGVLTEDAASVKVTNTHH